MIYIKTKLNKKVYIIIIIIIAIFLMTGTTVHFYIKETQDFDVIIINKCDFHYSEFWQIVYEGMMEAMPETGVNYEFISAYGESEIEAQKQIILEAIEREPDAIILVASDYNEIAPYGIMIAESGIKLILMDSDVGVSFEYKEVYIGTNSVKAGFALGLMAMKNTPSDNKRAIILSHVRGSQTALDREAGIREGYGDEYIVETYSCHSDENVAYEITKQVLEEDERVANIFCTNENVTIGAARAVFELGAEDRVNIYGFDGSKEHVKYLEMGILNYTVIQRPYQMGYLSVETTLAVLNNEEVPQFIETDFLLINQGNMYDIGYREIMFPFIK